MWAEKIRRKKAHAKCFFSVFFVIIILMNKQELFEIITKSKDLQSFVDACALNIKNPFWIMDGSYRVLAQSHDPDARDYLIDFDAGKTMERVNAWVDNGLLEKVSGNRKPVFLHDDHIDEDIVIMDIIYERRPIGKLTIVLHENMNEDEVINISNAAAVYLRVSSETPGTTYEQALALLLQDTPESEHTGRKILENVGYLGKPPYHIVKADVKDKERIEILRAFLVDIRSSDPTLVGAIISNQCYILLCNGHDIPDRLIRKKVRLGYSLPFAKLHLVKSYATQADIALLNGNGKAEYFTDHYDAFLQECIRLGSGDKAGTFIMPEILEILKYDAEYKTEYFETLKHYVQLNCSKQKTADAMNLHLNTVKYRINQLEKTFGIDFTKMDAIYVSLAAAKIWIG